MARQRRFKPEQIIHKLREADVLLGREAVSERRACSVLGQPRTTHRHPRKVPNDERRPVKRIVALATQFGRYGYRRITALLRAIEAISI